MGQNIFTIMHDMLTTGQKLVLATTIRRSGSTPRDAGSMCIITQDGQLIGTVGGGLLEYKVQKRAKELLKLEESFIYKFKLDQKDLAGAGMICGGSADLFLEVLSPKNRETVSLFGFIHDNIASNKSGTLITCIKDGISAMDPGARMFIKDTGETKGMIPGLDHSQISLGKNIACDLILQDDKNSKVKNMDLFVHKIAISPEVFLFGAGHVALFVGKLAKMVDFNITVIDDRKEFANKERFPDADKILVAPFDKAFDQLKISSNSYILIFTRGHLFDKVVLQQALGTNASYIGMIGSIRKRNTIYDALLNEGFSKDELNKVYSPIGLDINAETPEEIAVSIVGELIKKRGPEKKSKKLII